jgi:hypothetical protein
VGNGIAMICILNAAARTRTHEMDWMLSGDFEVFLVWWKLMGL